MKRRFVQIAGELVEVTEGYTPEPRADYHVMPDITPFKSNDGAEIKGRTHWREHLKATGAVEMGHSDVKVSEAAHAKRREAFQARARSSAAVRSVDAPVLEAKVENSNRIRAEVLNRLHNRPPPDRKTLIKIALEEARRRR